MANATPAFESSPKAAVSPLMDRSVPILIGAPEATVTQPNCTVLQSTAPLAVAVLLLPPLLLLFEHAAATNASTTTAANGAKMFRCFMDPPPLTQLMQMCGAWYHICVPEANHPCERAIPGYGSAGGR